MKRFALALAALVFSAGVFAQSQATVKKPEEVVKFKETTHDFGKIKQGVPVTYDYYFVNVAGKPVIIESATASCGCTTPQWPQAPVAKGKEGKITAGFNAAAAGVFGKSITVKIAGIDQPLELKFNGEVLSAEEYAKYEKEKSTKKSK
jgi:hypothetical protein